MHSVRKWCLCVRVPLPLTLTAPAILIYIISRWTDAGVRTRDVDTSVLTQKLRETALIQVCTKQETELTQKRTSAPTVFSVQAQASPPQYVWVKSACFARSQSCSLLFLNCVDLACDKLEPVSYSTPALCDPAANANIFILFSSSLSYHFFLQKCISVSGSLPTQLFTLLQR